jgi:hypothetical protein
MDCNAKNVLRPIVSLVMKHVITIIALFIALFIPVPLHIANNTPIATWQLMWSLEETY